MPRPLPVESTADVVPVPAAPAHGLPGERRPGVSELRRAAVVAGVGLLVLAVLAAGVEVLVLGPLVTDGDATRTAADLAGSAGVVRLAIAALLVVAALDVVVAWALMKFFEPVDHTLSRLAAWFRLGYAVVFVVAVGQLTTAVRLLGGDQYLTTFSPEQLHTQALADVQDFDDIWHLGLALFGIHLVLIGYLAYRSGYVPRVLGVLLVIAGCGYLVDTFAGLLVTRYTANVSAVTFVGEAALMIWLLVRGRRLTPGALRHLDADPPREATDGLAGAPARKSA